MSWWKYNGNVNNLFGQAPSAPSSANSTNDGRGNTTKSSVFLASIDGWTNGLEKAKTFTKVHDICKAIFAAFLEIQTLQVSDISELAAYKCLYFALEEYVKRNREMDATIWGQENAKMIMKTFYKLSQLVAEVQITDCMIGLEFLYPFYGMMASNSNFYKRYEAKDVMRVCLKQLKEYGGQQCVTTSNFNLWCHFPVAVETVLLAIKTLGYGHHEKLSKRLWFIIALNLEMPVPRVRELLLLLFQQLITDKPYFEQTVLPQLVNEWPWTNRNKYSMLALVVAKYKFVGLQKYGFKNLEPDVFMRGMSVSLHYPSLMPSSQTLVGALAKENVPQLYNTVADILANRSFDDKFRNVVKFWVPKLESRKLFETMHLNIEALLDSDVTAKTVVFRRIFAGQLEAEVAERMSTKIVKNILPGTEEHVLEIIVRDFLNAASPEDHVADLVSLFKQLSENATLHDDMLLKISSLLKNKSSPPSLLDLVRSEIVECELSKDLTTSNPACLEFALRVYELIGKAQKLTNHFHDQLYKIQQHPSIFSSRVQEISINQLMDTLKSPLDPTAKQQKIKFLFETCKQLLTGSAVEAFVAAPRYARLLIHLAMTSEEEKAKKFEVLNMFFGHLWSMLVNNYNNDKQSNDPLQMYCGEKRHLAGYVACLSEFLLHDEFDVSKIKINVLSDIMDLMVNYLSSGPPVRPSDEDTEQRLEELVARSTFVSDLDRQSLKECLMTSLSYTIQALAKYFELLGKRVLNSTPSSKVNEILDNTLTNFIKIFTSFSHEATLKVVGPYFGGFIETATKKLVEYIRIPSHLYFLHGWDGKFKMIMSIAVSNESASRFRSVRGFSVYISELMANDFDEKQNMLQTFLVHLTPDRDGEFYMNLGDEDPGYKKLERELFQLAIDKNNKKSNLKKGDKLPIVLPSDSDSSDLDDDEDDDLDQLPSDWESFTSKDVRGMKLKTKDGSDKHSILSDKLYKLKCEKEAVHLKAYFERFGTFQLHLIIQILEHPKMGKRPVIYEEAYQLLEFTLYKYFWGTVAEQELCLRIYELLLKYFTRHPDAVPVTTSYQPPKVSIVEVMYQHFICFDLMKIEPTREIYALILKFLAQFDYRNSIVRITDQKYRQGMSWVAQNNLSYIRMFSAQKPLDEPFDMYNTKINFLEDPELRSLYAKFQSQIVMPNDLVESIQTNLDSLIGELMVETPNEHRMLFDAEYVSNMIARAVVHSEQIYIYDVDAFYEDLREIVKEKAAKHGASSVPSMVKTKMLDLLSMIGFEEVGMVVQKLLNV